MSDVASTVPVEGMVASTPASTAATDASKAAAKAATKAKRKDKSVAKSAEKGAPKAAGKVPAKVAAKSVAKEASKRAAKAAPAETQLDPDTPADAVASVHADDSVASLILGTGATAMVATPHGTSGVLLVYNGKARDVSKPTISDAREEGRGGGYNYNYC